MAKRKVSSLDELPRTQEYLNRVGAIPRSFRSAAVMLQKSGYNKDVILIRFSKDGEVTCTGDEDLDLYLPTDDEKAQIKTEFKSVLFPEYNPLSNFSSYPENLSMQDEGKKWWRIFGRDGNTLLMIHERVENEDGEKYYRPWTYWSDNQWRPMEPDCELPVFGVHHVRQGATVFLHEGTKAADFVQKLVNPRTATEEAEAKLHPWYNFLSQGVHLGWIGGAYGAHRTDWAPLVKANPGQIIVVADNDKPGREAVRDIAKHLKDCVVWQIQFNEQFPPGFDLADPFPETFFRKSYSGERVYCSLAPSPEAMMHPATWATVYMPGNPDKGIKPYHRLNERFLDLWGYVQDLDGFICIKRPGMVWTRAQFNNSVRYFSDIVDTGGLVLKEQSIMLKGLAYDPSTDKKLVNDGNMAVVNTYIPPNVHENDMDIKPFQDFMEHLIPDEKERYELMRWCATLIARPDIKMHFGVLLISNEQGIGKNTLGERILGGLVGEHNTGLPNETMIVESAFNDWAVRKRFVFCPEIYQGRSWKAYNVLKTYISDDMVQVNEKFMKPYKIKNWAHIMACSNNKSALRVDDADRRWFLPKVTETQWPKEKWDAFYPWLEGGGLGAILRWARQFNNYISKGERPMETQSKRDIIAESRSDVVAHWEDTLESNKYEKVAMSLSDVTQSLQRRFGKIYENGTQLRDIAIKKDWYSPEDRIKLGNRVVRMLVSPILACELDKLEGDNIEGRKRELIRKHLKNYDELSDEGI